MVDFNARRISDPVHNTISLSDVEVSVIGTRSFQRLRNVRQLGLASLVFPGADYSRLSHSIGVCHITSRILDALRQNCRDFEISTDQLQNYRLAGLLHDVGHYPFSHAMEEAIENHFLSDLLADGGEGSEGRAGKFYRHEHVGGAILDGDIELRNVLLRHNVDATSVASIFSRSAPDKLTNLISSDLDADRIDYLLRTAHFSGLPYGSVDLEYLLTQIRVDSQGRICLTNKALRAADHFLLSRYFDYQQVAFHKTVAAFELVLKDVLRALLVRKMFDCSQTGIVAAITSGKWAEFDDTAVWARIRELADDKDASIDSFKANSLLTRSPPKLVGQFERVDSVERGKEFQRRLKAVKRLKDNLAAKYNIDPSLWYVWSKDGITLTKVGSHVPVGMLQKAPNAKDKDKYEQAIRIISSSDRTSTDIMSLPQSLMSILSDNALYLLRMYVLLPDDKVALREAIANDCLEEFSQ